MINKYIDKLIENLPDEIKNNKSPLIIDLVLDGGLFNGSYLLGALYFLKEMENRKYIKIEKISGCSIGSVAAFVYLLNSLDLMLELYKIILNNFKKTYTLKKIKNLKNYLKKHIPENICEIVNNKLYITYYNIHKNKKIVKNKYKNVNEIIETIIKSCFIPFLIDGNLLYNKKYIDGFNPYIFKENNGKKVLFLDLFGYDKINGLINVKNEKTNHHRILSGLLDIHNFFIKKSSTSMCSYVNNWSILNKCFFNIKLLIEKIIVYIIIFGVYLKKRFNYDINDNVFLKIISKIVYDLYIILLETYCL
jgi:hypothetical protein